MKKKYIAEIVILLIFFIFFFSFFSFIDKREKTIFQKMSKEEIENIIEKNVKEYVFLNEEIKKENKKNTSSFEKKIEHYCKKYDINPKIIKAIAVVETNNKNIVGDGHLKNHAYGYFQIRQPAINEINRVFELNKIKRAEELLNDIDSQIEYVVLFVKHLKNNTNNEKEAISAYNIGLSNVKKGKFGKYYEKVKKAMLEV